MRGARRCAGAGEDSGEKNLRRMRFATCSLILCLLIADYVSAEEYEFELDVAFGSSDFDGRNIVTTDGGTIFNAGTTDTDEFSVFGTWYFNGLTDDEGPRARAALFSRASSLTLGLGRAEQSNTFVVVNNDPTLPFSIPDLNNTFESDGDLYSAAFRYVDQDSGWFGTVGLESSDTDTNGFVSETNDIEQWRVGVGKYIYSSTTLSVEAGQIDYGVGADASVYRISLEHLGNIGRDWKYAIDFDIEHIDGGRDYYDQDAVRAALSLYPTRDFEFGIAVSDRDRDRGFRRISTGHEAFASWFVTPNVKLSAAYGVSSGDYIGNVGIGGAPEDRDGEQDTFGISATWRFD